MKRAATAVGGDSSDVACAGNGLSIRSELTARIAVSFSSD